MPINLNIIYLIILFIMLIHSTSWHAPGLTMLYLSNARQRKHAAKTLLTELKIISVLYLESSIPVHGWIKGIIRL